MERKFNSKKQLLMPYVSFYSDFPEIATNETRQITIENSKDLRKGIYYLVELFCNEKNCDCKRMIFTVVFGPKQTAVAEISYGAFKLVFI